MRSLDRSLSLSIQPHVILERFFPSINTFCGSEGSIVKFKLIKHLELDSICTTFLAVTEAPVSKNIVVKFVHRYNEEAHKLLADKDIAPKLLYYGKIISVRDSYPSCGGLHMVVMDYVDGMTRHCASAQITSSELSRPAQRNLGSFARSRPYVWLSSWPKRYGYKSVKNGLGVMRKDSEHDTYTSMLSQLVSDLPAFI